MTKKKKKIVFHTAEHAETKLGSQLTCVTYKKKKKKIKIQNINKKIAQATTRFTNSKL